MPSIYCRNMPTEKAIRIFRKKCEADKIKERCRELEFYEKPTVKRQRKKNEARKRHLKSLKQNPTNYRRTNKFSRR
jgi:small subunit ribosomal protein S21